MRMIAALPSEQGDVILLRLLADLDVAQVAKIMEKRGSGAHWQLRGLRMLEHLMHASDHAARSATR